jgi:Spy/CpxP family protein refolding chaperone
MKKTAIVLTVVTGLITATLLVPSFADRGHHGFWRHGHGPRGFGFESGMKVERMLYRLDLSQEQRQQIFAVLDEARPAMRDIGFTLADYRREFKRMQPTDDNYQARLTEIADDVSRLSKRLVLLLGETRAKVAALLTDEQREQLRQMPRGHRHGFERKSR